LGVSAAQKWSFNGLVPRPVTAVVHNLPRRP